MTRQADLFATPDAPTPAVQPNEEFIALTRARLQATLALVRDAEDMPWDDHLTIIRHDNDVRFGVELLPKEEGAALWAEFDAHMNRLYAVMNARLAAEGTDD